VGKLGRIRNIIISNGKLKIFDTDNLKI
jgi:hypothetical protein